MQLDLVLESFGNLLETRIGQGVFTTEDSIRYTFFAALMRESDLQPENVVLEHPHPTISRAEVDTWVPPSNGRQGLAVEFKYDRKIPSGHNTPRTQKAGKVFHDLYRLGQVPSTMQRLFIYVAGPEMTAYFKNHSNGLVNFFDLPKGKSERIDSAFLAERSATFVKSAAEVPNIYAVAMYARRLPMDHELRVFEVINVTS